MKAAYPMLAFLAVAAARGVPAAADAELSHFSLVSPDYKRPVDVPQSFFNPFKIQVVTDADARRDVAVTNEVVTAALAAKGLSGLLYASQPALNRVILGDDIFSVGDELQFSSDTGTPLPLVTGATVVLRRVESDKLTLEVTPAGEAARTLTYPLRAFWRP